MKSKILEQVYTDGLKEAQPLIDRINSGINETTNYRLAVVCKCPFGVIGALDHDWIKLHESSLNDRDFKNKIFALVNNYVKMSGGVHDFILEAKEYGII